MTDSTRVRVSSRTSGEALMTRETVFLETPASRAMSLMVTLRPAGMPKSLSAGGAGATARARALGFMCVAVYAKSAATRNCALETGIKAVECQAFGSLSRVYAVMPGAGLPPVTACRIHPDDDVAVALVDLPPGSVATLPDGTAVPVAVAIPRGHKLALADLPPGATVRKYGAVIGRARAAIARGGHVHTANLETRLAGLGEFHYQPAAPVQVELLGEPRFRGYRRDDGRVGTRNEIWIIATVGCVARLSQRLAEAGRQRYAGRIDGVHALTHPFGCSQTGRDLDNTRRILAALASHPNAGGVLIVGLGCESNQARDLLAAIQRPDLDRVRVLSAQAEGDEFERGLALLDELVAAAAARYTRGMSAPSTCAWA